MEDARFPPNEIIIQLIVAWVAVAVVFQSSSTAADWS